MINQDPKDESLCQRTFRHTIGFNLWCTPFALCYGLGANKLSCSIDEGQILISTAGDTTEKSLVNNFLPIEPVTVDGDTIYFSK
jgi:hypothetical protein